MFHSKFTPRSMAAAGGEKHEANVDLENDQAVQNWLSSVKGTISVDMMCESASMMQWVREQLNRNGKVESYMLYHKRANRIIWSTYQARKKEREKKRTLSRQAVRMVSLQARSREQRVARQAAG